MATPLPPIPESYYENFLESLAQIVSKLLTDKETETVLASIRSFQDKLKRLSSQNLVRLQLEATAVKKQDRGDHYCQHEGKTCTQNCVRGFVKAFVVGFGIKYLIGLLPLIISGKIFKRPGLLKQLAGRDTTMFALFLSTFLSSYKGILCLLRRFRKNHDPSADRLNAFIAGAVAGMALFIDKDKRRRQSIMLYLLTRSIQFSGAWSMKQWAKHRKVKHNRELAQLKEKIDREGFAPGQPRRLEVKQHWDDRIARFMQRWAGVAVMMIASSQIVYGFLFHGETLPKSYYAFLLTHSGWKGDFGGMAAPLTQAIGDTVTRLGEEKGSIRLPPGMTSREFIAENVSPNIATIIPPKIRHNFIMCALQHPLDPSCTRSKLTLFRDEYFRALKLYVPLNVIMTLVFRSGQLTKDPSNISRKFVYSCLRSGLFLAMYVASAFATPCAVRPIVQKERTWIYLIPGLVAGAMTAIEVPSRQLELGLYCLPRAMESWWKLLVKSGYARNIPNGDVALFMLAMGTLMTMYQNDKDTISSHYLNVMTRFFGHN
ncbi:hypothetical protein LRAMOSA01941 [Lichtheimia ramosa]|uniref:Transmembrane protein 135 N-terminal domain-containing protein n=1 Tax=Lichtheimia ramosa TaxID=688394 RepID=A0A077WMS5_9FUNG|nr:hypothetical protein LRAMOSA01941 [Lichtheimia ramosa]